VGSLKGSRLRRVVMILSLGLALLFSISPAWAKTLRVAIIPFHLYSDQDLGYLVQGMRDMLTSRLASPERELVEPAEIETALAGLKPPLTKTTAGQVMAKLEADFIIYGSVTKLGPQYSLNWQILKATAPDLPTGLARTATEDDLIPIIDEMAGLAGEVISGRPPTVLVTRPKPGLTQAEEAVTARPEEQEPPRSEAVFVQPGGKASQSDEGGAIFRPQKLNRKLFLSIGVNPRPLAMAIADFDGDKGDEVILIAEKEVLIFGFQDDQPRLLTRLKSPLYGRLLMVSAGDIDGDGRAEVALTALSGSLPRSELYKVDGNQLRRLARLGNHHLRIIASPQGPILAAQEGTITSLFNGPFIRLELKGSKLVPVGGITGSSQIEFPTLALGDVTADGQVESLGLSQTEKLTVVSPSGTVLYRSGDTFGGTNNVVILPDRNPKNEDITYSLNAPLMVIDLDGDGRSEVLAVHNTDTARRVSVNLSHYRKGSVFGLSWTGTTMATTWRTPQVEEYAAAAGIARLKGGGRLLMMAVSEPEFYGGTFKLWEKTKGYLFRAPLTFEKKAEG